MKTLNKTLLIALLAGLTFTSYAQRPKTGCVDANIQAQSEGIKTGYGKQGYTVFQEALFQMTSMEPVPVAVKLTQGVPYQLVFIGNEHASRVMMEIYDGQDHKIDEKIERADNNIVFSYTPTKTDVYLITITQKKALKDMCGYFGVLAKGLRSTPVAKGTNPPTAVKPAPAPVKATVKTTTTTTKTVNNKPAATTVTTTTKTATPATAAPAKDNGYKDMPANQRPNPNRTRATNEAMQQQHK